MLLRKISKHVKEQNWFAVVLDFLIVVVGILIAFKITNWAADQERRDIELRYTERLHSEVVKLQDTRGILLPYRYTWAEGFKSASNLIFSEENRDLTADECEALAYSYIVTNPTDDLASLIELQGSGQLSLFSNKRLSEALSNYLLIRSRARDAGEGIAITNTNFSGKYPNLVSIVSSASGPGYAGVYACDLEAMRADQAFRNDFETTKNNYLSHTGNNKSVSDSLADLHRVLDGVLGLTHQESSL